MKMPTKVRTTTFNTPSPRARERRPTGGFFLPGFLTLADGQVFPGFVPKNQRGVSQGEVVFSTGMTGYVESLTDPSYTGQILTFTYPLIGNYGVHGQESWEGERIHAQGVVTSEICQAENHAQSEQSFLHWLQEQHIPLITGVDTRALTKHLRVHGTVPGVISRTGESPKRLSPTPFVSVTQPVLYNQHYQKKVILVDCGLKLSILRELLKLPVAVKRVPFDYDYTHEAFDGVVVSNGPGDPESYRATITILRKALRVGKPIFGICLGSQLLALAAGAKTYKLPFGHRGHNQPCLSTVSGQGYITSQNHGYAVDEKSLPQGWNVTFRNLNDDSVEGITHAQRPFFSVQFHPEARPGPTDTAWLFQEFYQKI